MIRLYVLTFLIYVLISCKNQKPNKEKEGVYYDYDFPRWQVTGMISPCEDEEIEAAKQMGFDWVRVHGCLTSSSIQNKVDINNRITDSILIKRIGVDWKKKHELLAYRLFTIDTTVIFLIKRNMNLNVRIKEIENRFDYVDFDVCRTFNENVFVVNARYFENRRKINFLRVTLDLKKQSFITIDTTRYLE